MARNMTHADQLREAVGRCEVRLKIAHSILRQCDPANQRTFEMLRGDFYRASDDLASLKNRLDEALDAGSLAFRRVNAEQLVDAAE